MRSKYIEKIRSSITIKTSRKTSQLLNGLHRSVYKGKSLDFDNLREYEINDDIRNVDWKSSIRHGGLLVRQYIAERRHNILFIIDSNASMDGETASGEEKTNVALMTAGTIAYLSNENGDSIGFLTADGEKMRMQKFSNGSNYIDLSLQQIEKYLVKDSKYSVNDMLDYINKHLRRKMIVFVITDLNGYSTIEDTTIRKTVMNHELFFININDASICDDDAYDMSEKKYVPKFMSKQRRLRQIEQEVREEIETKSKDILKKYRVHTATIDDQEEIIEKVIGLLERHNHAING